MQILSIISDFFFWYPLGRFLIFIFLPTNVIPLTRSALQLYRVFDDSIKDHKAHDSP